MCFHCDGCTSMLSYQWDYQAITERLNISLLNRGYLTWFDLTNMKGAWLTTPEG